MFPLDDVIMDEGDVIRGLRCISALLLCEENGEFEFFIFHNHYMLN